MPIREVRLGLVLYGGVSLAIYENGITQEIYRSICGDGVYALIRELIDSDIVVDVISGTSAGGVNGVMLGYCLAQGFDFLPAAQLWRDAGDIQKLMRKPEDTDTHSVLDSVYYQEQLANCFRQTLQEPRNGRIAPPITELDLFVTGTDAHGVVSTIYDELGHPIDVKKHRALFQLQYRGNEGVVRKNDFAFRTDPETDDCIQVNPDDLAKLSRLTSGFPAAFRPTEVTAADMNFYRWGNLNGPAVYMDGGILNNKPFTSTIDAIAGRTATREVERFLIYVEPSPERFQQNVSDPEVPTLVEAAFNSLVSIPSYQSIAADLEAIEAHNEKAQRFQRILGALEDAPDAGPDCLQNTGAVPTAPGPEMNAYIAGRLTMVNDAAISAILDSKSGHRDFFPTAQQASQGNDSSPVAPADLRRSGRLLVQSFWSWEGDELQTLIDYDVFYRKRRVDHLSNILMTALKAACNKKPMEVPTQTWEAVNHLFQLCEIAEWAMKRWLTQCDLEWASLSARYSDMDSLDDCARQDRFREISVDIWAKAKNELDKLMTCDVDVPAFAFEPKAMTKARKAFYDDLMKWMKSPAPGSHPNLLLRLDDTLKAALELLQQTPPTHETGVLLRNEFCRFLEVDRQLLPLKIGSNFESTNAIRVVRFSPLDAQRGLSKVPLAQKVKGTALANFGAFFKKGWRANDIMMGRFDAVCLLTECLLTKERLTAMASTRRGPNGQPYTVPAGLVASCLPDAKNALAIEAAINAYFATPAQTKDAWETMVNLIVEAAQDRISAEEWPVVAQCTLEQHYDWGQYKQESALPAGLGLPRKWTPGKATPDELLVRVATQAIRDGMLPPYAVSQTSSFWSEVPFTALQEELSLAVVRLGKSLGDSVPEEHRASVKGSLGFRVGLDWIPSFFYRLSSTRRTQPDWVLVPVVVLFNATLLALVVFAWMLEAGGRLTLPGAMVTTAAVVAATMIQWTLTQAKPRKIASGVLLMLVIFGGTTFLWHHGTEQALILRWAFSYAVIALVGLFPLRGWTGRLVCAAIALALLFLIWGPKLLAGA
jgi:patatin-related protein